MHASIEQLLNLRDGAPVVSDAARHVAGCAHCSDELERLRQVRRGLQALPAVAAPAQAWTAIAGKLDTGHTRRRYRAALAAAIAVAAVIAWAVLPGTRQGPGRDAPELAVQEQPRPANLDTLVAQSRQLEQLLRTLDRQSPHIMSAGTAGTIASLQDGIAAIDYGLSYNDQISGEASQRLWRQRVDLMNSLVQVRGAQLQQISN